MEQHVGRLVGGVWLPASETHMVEVMAAKPQMVDGKLTYQYRKLEKALSLVKQFRTALDIGAHCGLWSMHLVKRFQHVHAFEPIPLHRELFAKNVDMRNVTLHAVALGESEGFVSMTTPDETTGNSHVSIKGQHPGTHGVSHPDLHHKTGDIPIVRLDSLNRTEVDFIKIDVEGFERAVVAGGEQTIRREKPVIIIEQKGNDSAYGDAPKAALSLLQKWGAVVAKEISGDFILQWP